jgi:hypothetical protein
MPTTAAPAPLGRLPLVFTDKLGKRWLIRGMPVALLTAVVRLVARGWQHTPQNGGQMTREMGVALARELRARKEGSGSGYGSWRSWCQQIDPDPCACGGPGLYLVGPTTFCRQCFGRAKQLKAVYAATYDQRQGTVHAEVQALRRIRDGVRAHHRARGRAHGNRIEKG